MSVSLVPLIYLNRSDLYVARSANVARYQPYPYRAMLAGHSMQSACRQCMATTSGMGAYCGVNRRYTFARHYRGYLHGY
jgi:hypothetical protein